jgi:hypothetical protein
MDQIARAIGYAACALVGRFVPQCQTAAFATTGYLIIGVVAIAVIIASTKNRRT